MPYTTKGKCVYKKDTAEKVGCTDGSVSKYLAALHANADESIQREGTQETLGMPLPEDKVSKLKEVIRSIVQEVLKESKFSK